MIQSRPSIRSANILFLIVIALAISIGSWLQASSFNLGLAATEVGIILVPTLIALAVGRLSVRETLLLKPLSLSSVMLCVAIGIVGWPTAVVLGALSEMGMRLFGPLPGPLIPPVSGAQGALVYLVLFSLLAPLCEETLMRGFIQRAYEQQGLSRSVLYGALFFGLFHLSPTRFLSTAFLGWVMGQAYARTRSLYGSMIVHATNNGLVACIMLLAGEMASDAALDTQTMWYGIACWLGIAAAALPVLMASLRALGPVEADEPTPAPIRRPLLHWAFVGTLLLYALMCAVEISVRAGGHWFIR